MSINIFEGARRIAVVIGAFWLAGWLGNAVFSRTYPELHYVVAGLGAEPMRALGCGRDDAVQRVSADDAKGPVDAVLCFRAQLADNGKMLVPYANSGNGKWWMQDKYSSEVSTYTAGVGQRFRLPVEDFAEAIQERRQARFEKFKEAGIGIGLGLGIGWLLVTLVGWIVRGFCGIQRGQDRRSPRPPQQPSAAQQ